MTTHCEPQKPYKVITWEDPEGTGAIGWIVIHNLVNGIAGGGLFMHKSATYQETADLAYTMSLKNSLQTPIFGGGKGGIKFDPYHPEAKGVLKRFLLDNIDILRTHWCTGGDLYTSTTQITSILREISNLESPFYCLANMLQNKGFTIDINQFKKRLNWPENAFMTIEEAITGYSITKIIESQVQANNQPCKIVLQGFGQVGKAVCNYIKHPLQIVGICEHDWFIYDPNGIDVHKLLSSNTPYDFLPIFRTPLESNEDFLVRFLQITKADLFCPCAYRYCITDKVLKTLLENTFINTPTDERFIVSGANNIFESNKLVYHAIKQQINVIPEWVSNAGCALLFVEALKYQRDDSTWQEFIKEETFQRMSKFLREAQTLAKALNISTYEACYQLGQQKLNAI